MKNVKALSIAALATLSLISFGSFAESVSVTSSTLDGAESKIAAQAQERICQKRLPNGQPFLCLIRPDGRLGRYRCATIESALPAQLRRVPQTRCCRNIVQRSYPSWQDSARHLRPASA
jgi:hypothetical protein